MKAFPRHLLSLRLAMRRRKDMIGSFHPVAVGGGAAKRGYRSNMDGSPNWIINKAMQPYIQSCHSSNNNADDNNIRHEGFNLCFLGTGAGKPSLARNNAATALDVGGHILLLDAGEGTQMQLMASRLTLSDITTILITHLHADHVLGLPGLLLSMQDMIVQKSSNNTLHPHVVHIYGPVGLHNFIATSLSLTFTELHRLQVVVHELTPDQSHDGSNNSWLRRRSTHPGAVKTFRDFQHRNLTRTSIAPQIGVWTLRRATHITNPAQVDDYHDVPSLNYTIQAAEIPHVPKLQTFGYVIQESLTLPRNVNADQARAAGVAPGKKYRRLKFGFAVPRDDDPTTMVRGPDVWTDEVWKSRKLVYLGDCCGLSAPMLQLAQDADVLVHEATLLDEHDNDQRPVRGALRWGGHSTAAMAGHVARMVQARVLVLNHVSAAYHRDANRLQQLVHQAQGAAAASDTSTTPTVDTLAPPQVQLADDFMELVVPRLGFAF